MKIEEIWEKLIFDKNKTWAVFEHGTCVIIMNHKIDPRTDAIELMKKNGPVYPGTPSGDFRVGKLNEIEGWLVFYDHPDIINYVSPDELAITDQIDENKAVIGLKGREKRILDSKSLNITFIYEKSKN